MSKSFDILNDVIKTLLGPEGCPWDKQQTPESMRKFLVEEIYECVDAIGDSPLHAREELGDVIFDALLVCNIYENRNEFLTDDVLTDIAEKMVRRHPHVKFSEDILTFLGTENSPGLKNKSVEEINAAWDKIKNDVEMRKTQSVLEQVPESFPPLLKSYKYLSKAASIGFDWDCAEQAEEKVLEEIEEIREAQTENDETRLEEELGDFLLAAVNLVRKYGASPDVVLQKALKKFEKRFNYVEQNIEKFGCTEETKKETMLELWKEAKGL